MSAAALLLLAIAAGCALVSVWAALRVLRAMRTLQPAEPPPLLLLQTQVEALREQVRGSLEGSRLELDRRLEETNRVVGDVRRGLGEVDRQVRTVTAVARDLRGLQELLRAPKARGGLGEYLLIELLAQVLPQAHYTAQYEFAGGERVDAVLRVGEGLVPVDAKFPLENFQRLRESDADERARVEALRGFRQDVRRHVDAIAKRYIRPGEGTYEFALMYIPSEAVYQEVIRQDDDDGLELFRYSLMRQVVPVSPQSFYAYLQVIVLGLRGLSIERHAREIMGRLGEIRGRFASFGESFDLVARHLTNAQRQAEEAGRRLSRLEASIATLSADTATPAAPMAEPTEAV